MMQMSRVERFTWSPLRAPWLWVAGAAIGVLGGMATLELNPLLALPVALAWVYVGLRKPRLVGLAGAMAGHGAAWIGLLLTASFSCASTCWWSLPYGPTHTADWDAWRASELQWIAVSAIVLIAGIVLSVLLAWRLRGSRRSP